MARDRALLIAEIPHLRRYAHALERDREAAEDLVQGCLERAVRSLDQWDASRRLRPWLFAILRNLHLDDLRRRRLHPAETDPAELPWRGPSAEDRLTAQSVLAAVDRLPEDHRNALTLVGLNELSYAEAAEVLGIPVGTLMSRLHRAREALRKSLGMTEGGAAVRVVK